MCWTCNKTAPDATGGTTNQLGDADRRKNWAHLEAYQSDELPHSGSGGIMAHSDDGATVGNYIECERKGESYVTTYKIDISSADAAKIQGN